MVNWQKIYSSENLQRANIVQSVLEKESFKPVLISKKDSSYQMGLYEIYVVHDFVIPALKLIVDEIRFEEAQ